MTPTPITAALRAAVERAGLSGYALAQLTGVAAPVITRWLRGERNIWVEHEHMLEKYGEELTAELEKALYGHYRTLGLLDCGVKPVEPLVEGTKKIADGLHLTQQVIPATVSYIGELLTGPWPADRFVRKAPGTEITGEDLLLPL